MLWWRSRPGLAPNSACHLSTEIICVQATAQHLQSSLTSWLNDQLNYSSSREISFAEKKHQETNLSLPVQFRHNKNKTDDNINASTSLVFVFFFFLDGHTLTVMPTHFGFWGIASSWCDALVWNSPAVDSQQGPSPELPTAKPPLLKVEAN